MLRIFVLVRFHVHVFTSEAELAKFLNKVEVGSEEERQKYISSLKADGTPRSGASGAVIDQCKHYHGSER